MAIDNLSLSPIRVTAPAPGALPVAANNGPAPAIAADSLKLSSPVSLLANANNVAAANTASVNTAAVKPAVVAAPAPAASGSYTVKPGDTLSGIAKDQLGDAQRWPEIYELNQAEIADPDLIYPGQTFKLPGAQPTTADVDTTPVDTTPVDVASDDDAPETAELPAPAPAPIRRPIPRDFPPYDQGPIRCFPHPQPPVRHDSRSELLKQKLELLKMEEQVVRLELQLDRMLKDLDAPTPVWKSRSPITQ